MRSRHNKPIIKIALLSIDRSEGGIIKKVIVLVNDTTINRFLGGGVQLSVPDNANVIDAIQTVDEVIKREGTFPLPEYGSLLHMVYNPIEDGFYVKSAYTPTVSPGKLSMLEMIPRKSFRMERRS